MVPAIMDFNDTDRYEHTELTEEQILALFEDRAQQLENFARPGRATRARAKRNRRRQRHGDHTEYMGNDVTHKHATTEHTSTRPTSTDKPRTEAPLWSMIA